MVHASEALRVLLFIAIVGLIYLVAAAVLVRRLVVRPRVPLRAWARGVLTAAAAGVLCMLYGRLIEPRWIEITQTRVTTPRLPVGHRGVRIVHLSDIHSNPEPLAETRLPAIVESLHPDLVVFTGDCANSERGLLVFRRCLAEIAKIAPTFAVRGNWDAWSIPGIDRFGGIGVTELDATTAGVDVAGTAVHVLGLASGSSAGGLGPTLAALPPVGPAIVIYHYPYPDVVPEGLASRVDLMCAGHVHGGQVALPFYGALLTLSKYGKRFERGLYPTADGFGFPLYVSRGIGMEGGPAPRVRFCARPEVALIELVPDERE